MGAMLCAIMALQHHIAELVVHPEVSQLLHDVGPVLGRIWVVKLYSSRGTLHAAPEQPTTNRLTCKFSLSLSLSISRFWIGYSQIEINPADVW